MSRLMIMIQDLQPMLERFDPISLGELDAVKLLDRMDTKFVFRAELLPCILAGLARDYRVLEIDGTRMSRYESLYFDTEGFDLYAKHHNGKLNRYKLRFRKYLDSGLCFFEIKLKTNKGRTIKSRIQSGGVSQRIEGAAEGLLQTTTSYRACNLKPKLSVMYTRCTFVSNLTPERLTIDLGLRYVNECDEATFPHLIIAELKREESSVDSSFAGVMERHGIRPGGISKYCLGVTQLYPDLKKNLFKQKARYLTQLAS